MIVEIVGSYNKTEDIIEIEQGEAFIRSRIGTLEPNFGDAPEVVKVKMTKERLLEIISDALEIPEVEIHVNFSDVSLVVR